MRRPSLLLALASLLAAVANCRGSNATSPSPPHASAIAVSDGNNQSGTVATALPHPLAVKVSDQSGNPFSGATVAWSVATGGGSLSPLSATTDGNGLATTQWTLGQTAGPNRATATVTSVGSATFDATGTPGPVAAVTVTAPSGAVTAGDFVQLSASAVDGYANAITGRTPTWGSSNASVATVTPTGLLLALGAGSTTASASLDGNVGTLQLDIASKPVPAGSLSITLGPPEVVFRWATHKCNESDVPDVPARLNRLSNGSLLLVDGNAPRNYVSVGPDFNSLKRNCTAVLGSADSTAPESYENQEWVWAPYRVGSVIHTLIHNEYHDPFAPNCQPGNTLPGNPCWYNSITYSASVDNGNTFTKPSPPSHAVAAAPLRWDPTNPAANTQPEGYFEPSNITQRADGYYYSVFFAIPNPASPATRGLCVMRTATLGDATSWRAWDGSGYNLHMVSPYVTGSSVPACTIVSAGLTSDARGSLTYNTYLNRYMLAGTTFRVVGGRLVCGFFYTLSSDLISWDPIAPFKEGFLTFNPCKPPDGTNAGVDVYPSIVDHDDQTINFERPGQTPYVYYTHYNNNTLDRDLLRRRMIIVAP